MEVLDIVDLLEQLLKDARSSGCLDVSVQPYTDWRQTPQWILYSILRAAIEELKEFRPGGFEIELITHS